MINPVYLYIIKDGGKKAVHKYCKMFPVLIQACLLQMWSHVISYLDIVLKASRWCSKRVFQKP